MTLILMGGAKVTCITQTQVNGGAWCYYYYYYYYYYLWVVTWATVWACVRGASWAKEGECAPCNATVDADNLTLPFVGFVCLEEEALLHPPSSCLVFFRGDFNLSLYLHHVPSTLVSVTLCTTFLDYDALLPTEEGLPEELEKVVCLDIEGYIKYKGMYYPVYLNITTLPAHPNHPPGPHALTALHAAPDQQWASSVNLTYELQRLGEREEVVGGLEFAHAEGCSYNGAPVLQEVSPSLEEPPLHRHFTNNEQNGIGLSYNVTSSSFK
ncbi:uncharacterized protein LOC135093222 [Scylla paramamosain]|uniref:uncharacterized protein LOC135093222 n=1 Tax=Scylla paramamosain TaxID=85552 RepID=UPI00308311B1